MRAVLGLCNAIDAMNTQVARGVKWLVLISVLIAATNAIMRKLFSISSNAYLEAQWYLFSAVFLLGAGFTLLRGEHVKIDILIGRFSRRTQAVIEMLGTAVFLMPFCVISVWLSLSPVLAKIASGEVSQNEGGLPLWPAWSLIPIGFGLLALQGVSEIVKRIAFLAGRAPDPAGRHPTDQG
ncbi:MAG: TRAP transporter small permease subunit [Hyphomicrobiales bacterium]|nr:TRAP transporter small permease subunit [Hyphomicrobiales bacterium]